MLGERYIPSTHHVGTTKGRNTRLVGCNSCFIPPSVQRFFNGSLVNTPAPARKNTLR